MEFLFLYCYDYFRKHRATFYVSFVSLFILVVLGASQVRIEEDVSKFFPKDKKIEKLTEVFQNSKLTEKVVVMVSLKDSAIAPQPDSLIAYTGMLVAALDSTTQEYISSITHKVDDQLALNLFSQLHNNLPIFLTNQNYNELDSLLQPEVLRVTIQNNYQQLISPAGIAFKRMIAQDPLSISMLAIKKIKRLQYDENFELYDSHVLTKDQRHLLLFLVPSYPANDTGHNIELVKRLDQAIAQATEKYPHVQAHYFGGATVAVGNAQQLRKDTWLTLSIMIVLLIVFLFAFLKKKQAPLLILLPVIFGALFSLCCVYLLQGTISVLAIAAGSIILGIAVNYSLHFLTHLRQAAHPREVIKELVQPMTIGSLTTVLAFFCLQFANAGVLKDVGLFAGFSLVGAALCTLIFLPHLVQENFFGPFQPTWIDKLSRYQPETNSYLVIIVLIITPVLLYFARDVSFNSDMNNLNFMTAETKLAEKELNAINEFSLRSVFIVTSGKNRETALQQNDALQTVLDSLKEKGILNKYSSVGDFIISDSLQHERIKQWNEYWTPQKKTETTRILHQEGEALNFSSLLYTNADSLLNRNYSPLPQEGFSELRENFFNDYITEKNDKVSIVTLAQVDDNRKELFYSALKKHSQVHALDKQLITTSFVNLVHADFNFIVTFTSLLVFFALLLAYGRIELTLITFVPMLITWIWILGIMALVGIEFNIINVMISTFIFGLGDDYSIFIMDGLQQEYRTGRKTLPTIKTSILLSTLTTISGLGVLIFAQHPALRSIATVSIIGIVCVFVMSQTLEPFFFRLLVTNATAKKQPPRTAFGLIRTAMAYTYFVSGAIVLTLLAVFMLKLWPFQREQMKRIFHRMLQLFIKGLVPISMSVKNHVHLNQQSLDKPAILIANHQSFLDIVTTIGLSHKLLLMTNRWVWNSPIYGFLVRLAEYYPADEGIDGNLNRMQSRLKQGYSILIFPEGTRSTDGNVGRFHKGAFFLAEQLQVDILPLVIHGSGRIINKKSWYVDKGSMSLTFLPRIEPDDISFGSTYQDRTKKISSYFKENYTRISEEQETPTYFRRKLINNYLYKGPVLEWYLRIKLSLEKNYEPFTKLIPKDASVLDLGCGYGFLCYLLHFISPLRKIIGVDFDEEKIDTASHAYSKGANLQFEYANVVDYVIRKKYDVIIISDVLHYLTSAEQVTLLNHAFQNITDRGMVIIRDGDKDLKEKHKGTKLSEFFSVKLLRFNKANQELNFLSGETIFQEVNKHRLTVSKVDDTKFTSNVIFVVKR